MGRLHRTRDPGETRTVRRLRAELAESRQIHRLAEDPLLVVVRLERQRRAITRGMWFFLALGLTYSTTGVQSFLAGHLPHDDPRWWGAWAVEPAFAGILILLLAFESEILSRGLPLTDPWVTRLKRTLLAASLFMNVYPTLRPRGTEPFHLGDAFVHAVIPLLVFMLAEVMPVIQSKFHEAKDQASQPATLPTEPASTTSADPTPTEPSQPDAAPEPPAEPAPVPQADAVPEPPTDSAPTAPADPAPAPSLRPALTTRLPAPMQELIQQAAQQAATEGRALTPADVRAVVRVPEALAEQIAQEMQARNGHAFV